MAPPRSLPPSSPRTGGGRPADDQEVGLRVYGAEVFSRTNPGACEDSQLVVPIGTDTASADSGDGAGSLTWVLVGLAALLALVGAVVVILRRRARTG